MKKGYTIPLCIFCGLFILCFAIFVYHGIHRRIMYESFVADIPLNPSVPIPSECATYGYPKADNTLRLYESADCNLLSGILNQNICYTAGKLTDLSGSYSYKCRGLNPVITPTQTQCSSLYTPQLSECQKNFTCAMNFSMVSNTSSGATSYSNNNLSSVAVAASSSNVNSSTSSTVSTGTNNATTNVGTGSTVSAGTNNAATNVGTGSTVNTGANNAATNVGTSSTTSQLPKPATIPLNINTTPPPPRDESLLN
jgi:hypothetical protein